MTKNEIEKIALSVPAEERPVPRQRLSGLGNFLGIYGGEHIAATEFVIGALLVTWGVKAKELLLGLAVGNLLATCMYAFCTAPIAVDTRLSLFAYLRKAAGPWFQRGYNAAWGATSVFYAAAMTAIAATSLKEAFSLPVQLEWYPTSPGTVALTLALAAGTLQKMMAHEAWKRPHTFHSDEKTLVERESAQPISPASRLADGAMEYIRRNAAKGITAADVAEHLHVSRRLCDMRFRECHGETVLNAILRCRFSLLKHYLATTKVRIKKITAACGFACESHAKRMFRKRYGMSMREWREKNRAK